MRTNRRYHTEGQIMSAIEAAKLRVLNYQADVERRKDEAARLFKFAHECECDGATMKEVWDIQNQGKTELELAEKAQKNVDRITKSVIPRLGEKLSVFRTPTLRLGNSKLEAHDIPV